MKNVQLDSIISKKATPLKSSNSIQDALISMSSNKISSVVIIDDNNTPVGIFTEHDSLKVVSNFIDTSSSICDVMTKDVFTIRNDININDAYIEMDKKGFNHLVVVDNDGSYLGIVTQGDFLRHATFKHLSIFKSISDIAINMPLTVEPTMLLKDVAKLMEERNFDFAIVVESNHPIALISQRDIRRHITDTQQKELLHQTISDIKTDRLHTLKKSSYLQEAIIAMEHSGIHQIIIVNDDDELIGIVSRHDLLEALYGSYFKHLINTIEMKNITLKKLEESKNELNRQTTFLNNVINTIPDLIWIKDLDGKYLTCNRSFEHFYGAPKDKIVGKTDYDFVDENLADSFKENDEKTVQSGKTIESEKHLVFADGSYSGLFSTRNTPMICDNGDVIGILGIAHDITMRKAREDKLQKLANYDFLTDIPNRSLLKYHLKKSMAKAKRDNVLIALIIFDLDRFKDVNDSYGHNIGDELLISVANRFSNSLREKDVIARMGGDEFALILDDINDIEDAAQIAQKMIDIISKPYMINGLELHVGSSAGIAIAPKNADTVDLLIQYADSALYKAKNDGRGNYRFYDDHMTYVSAKHLEYEKKLRIALANNELEVFYQPQVDIHTNKIIGAEALLRWNHPEDGIILPDLFIPIAEETGLIAKIGEFVLNQACADGKRWLDQGYEITLAVNISSHQLKYQNIPKIVDMAILDSGFNYNKLELEFTEDAIINRESEIINILNLLKQKGVRLAIDDFGTGYSSLAHLKRFPIDVIKIDKSFIDDILKQSDNQAIVIAIIQMAKALGYKVLSEGTEYIEQIEFLKDKGCNIYQGYYKSIPLPVHKFQNLLESEQKLC